MSHIYSILPASGVNQPYSYGSETEIPAGTLVSIDFGHQNCLGLVLGKGEKTGHKLKFIKTAHTSLPRLPDDLIAFLDKVASYTVSPKGLVLRLGLSAPLAITKMKKPFKGKAVPTPLPDFMQVQFEHAQSKAVTALKKMQGFSVALLDGVTGSGKTEVFFEAVAQVLRRDEQVLVLMPEIALTQSMTERFKKRFGCEPLVWHSELSIAARKQAWLAVAENRAKIIVGARSALFLPFKDLGLVVVDEEHESAFKQEDGVKYHGRDMAVLRAQLADCPCVLVSATPSLESYNNALAGKYAHLKLPSRVGSATLPEITLIDMRQIKLAADSFISPALLNAVRTSFERGEQSLLFLNRRGYAPLTLCQSCGDRMQCPNCTAWLVQHKHRGRLFCHHCGYGGETPKNCPSCRAENSLRAIGPGVERIAEEIAAHFPAARMTTLASDTIDDNPADLQTRLQMIQNGQVDMIIGTQIIAKGHHFPLLTCVGVIDADSGLQGGDLRASERTWQLLHQVAGRAGREALKGHVYIQTYSPENRLMQTLQQGARDAFLQFELEERKLAVMPPFSRLAALIISGKDPKKTETIAKDLALTAPQATGLRVLGPAAAPLFRLRGDYRWRLLIRAPKNFPLQTYIRDWLSAMTKPSSIDIAVDIDPITFL